MLNSKEYFLEMAYRLHSGSKDDAQDLYYQFTEEAMEFLNKACTYYYDAGYEARAEEEREHSFRGF